MRQIATYLIYIKKLVRDHNIENESNGINKLKTLKPTKMSKTFIPQSPYYFPTGNEASVDAAYKEKQRESKGLKPRFDQDTPDQRYTQQEELARVDDPRRQRGSDQERQPQDLQK